MTDKEKAKRYDEAIERAKAYQGLRSEMEIIFPELKESEDDKIKNQILYAIKQLPICKETKDKCIAWVEAQCKQKPAQKIEPKFKVGDWICHTFYKKPLLIIEDLGGGDFKTEPKSLITAQGFKEGVYRLWTIQDAKDGDVLICPMDKNSDIEEQIFLFYGVRDRGYVNNCIEYYCRVHDGVFYVDENGYMGTTSSPVYPATKEQRDLLFQKMHDAGYEFDTENKQLKKLIKK